MDSELVAALEPILRDLAATTDVRPVVRDDPWLDDAGLPTPTASAFLYAADGSGTGVWVELGRPRHVQVAALADQVQEWAVEALWYAERPTNWPSCPHHPRRHPLTAVAADGRAIWICPVSRAEVVEVGAVDPGRGG